MQIVSRKLPRNGLCAMLVADDCFRKGNIALVKTDFVISEKDLPETLKDAGYVFPIMVSYDKVVRMYTPI